VHARHQAPGRRISESCPRWVSTIDPADKGHGHLTGRPSGPPEHRETRIPLRDRAVRTSASVRTLLRWRMSRRLPHRRPSS
jgi:hypothetical protein